jgi:glycogen(starch) synthase
MKQRPLPAASAYAPWADAALFEVSWEVCNQVGGIYQVLRSKARTMVERWGDRYLVVGPYLPSMAEVEFEAERPFDFVAPVLERLAAEGLQVHCGRWLVDGRPRALLVEARVDGATRTALERRLARELGLDARSHDPLVQDVLGFGEAVRRLLQAFARSERAGPDGGACTPARLLAHFHEWVGGLALPLLAVEKAPVATIFTTHATSVGRYLSGSESGLYERLASLDGDGEAKRIGIAAQHQIERTCARRADVFTTVSPLTAEECDSILGRKPDLVTPNGLDIDRRCRPRFPEPPRAVLEQITAR